MGQSNSKLLEKIQEMNQEVHEMKEEIRCGHGTYYASMNTIWQQEKIPFEGAAKKLREYRMKDTRVLAIYGEADGTNKLEFKYSEETFPSDSMFPGKQSNVGNSSLAHSAPNDEVCIFTWGEVVALLTGKESKCMLESEELRNFTCGNTAEAKNPFRIWAWNYLSLPNDHDDYYDKLSGDKAVIITPIWNPSDVWEPETPYKLLVAATPEGYKWLMGITPIEEDAPQKRWLGKASPQEYETATEFLQLIVKALADLLNESDLIKNLQQVKETEKEKQKDASDQKKNFSLTGPSVLDLKKRFGEDFAKHFTHVYTAESASRKSGGTRKTSESASERKVQAASECAFAAKLVSHLRTKERMGRLGSKDSPKIYAPGKMSMPKKPILTIELGEFYKGKEKMIPDPYWLGVKAGASITRLYEVPVIGACDSLKAELANMKEGADMPPLLPGEIDILSDFDFTEVSDSISVYSESEFFTGAPGDDSIAGQEGASASDCMPICSESEFLTDAARAVPEQELELQCNTPVRDYKSASNAVTP